MRLLGAARLVLRSTPHAELDLEGGTRPRSWNENFSYATTCEDVALFTAFRLIWIGKTNGDNRNVPCTNECLNLLIIVMEVSPLMH